MSHKCHTDSNFKNHSPSSNFINLNVLIVIKLLTLHKILPYIICDSSVTKQMVGYCLNDERKMKGESLKILMFSIYHSSFNLYIIVICTLFLSTPTITSSATLATMDFSNSSQAACIPSSAFIPSSSDSL